MSRDSRSRSRSPLQVKEENSSRSRRPKKVIERAKGSGRNVPSECRVYVSNIPYEFKWQDLKDFFRSEVGDVAYVEMFMDDNGQPRGSAIVDFENSEMAQKAIEKMHRRQIKGRKLIVKEKDEIIHSRDFMFLFNSNMDRDNGFGKDLDQRRDGGSSFNFNRGMNSFSDSQPSPINFGNTYGLSVSFLESLGITGPLVNKVFVANLDYKVTEDNLQEVFKIAGKVINVEMIKDQDGKSRGFAVIEYEHPLQAVQSISMLHNQSYFDRKMSVRLDRVGDKKKIGSSSKLPPGLKGLGMGFGANGQAIIDLTGFPSDQSNSGLPSNSNPVCTPPVNNNMGMGGGSDNFNNPSANNIAPNLAAGVNAAMSMISMARMDSMPLGGGGGGAINSLNMGNSMGMLNQGNMNPMPNNSSFGNPGIGMTPQNGGNMFNRANNGGTMFSTPSNTFNSGLNSNNFNSNFASCRSIVKISNLPMDYTWQNLKDMCRIYGDIRFVEMKSKGVGWVRFSSEAEAQRTAELLNRQRFDGQLINACIA